MVLVQPVETLSKEDTMPKQKNTLIQLMIKISIFIICMVVSFMFFTSLKHSKDNGYNRTFLDPRVPITHCVNNFVFYKPPHGLWIQMVNENGEGLECEGN